MGAIVTVFAIVGTNVGEVGLVGFEENERIGWLGTVDGRLVLGEEEVGSFTGILEANREGLQDGTPFGG